MERIAIFTGRARLGEGLTAEKLFGVLTVGLEVDMETGCILDADCTLSTEIARNFFKKIVLGYSLKNGIDPLLKKFQIRYYGEVSKALGAALKNIYREYRIIKNKA